MESQASTSTDDTTSSPISVSGETSTSDYRSSSDVFLENMAGLVDRSDVRRMVELQRQMMLRYEKTNEMLLNFNVLSSTRYQTSVEDFRKHTQTLGEMRKDLDSIFKRIRRLKSNLNSQFPDAFSHSVDALREKDDGDDAEVTPKMSVSESTDIHGQVIHEEPELETETLSENC